MISFNKALKHLHNQSLKIISCPSGAQVALQGVFCYLGLCAGCHALIGFKVKGQMSIKVILDQMISIIWEGSLGCSFVNMYICRFKDMYINRIMLYTSAIIFKSLDLLLFTCSSLNQSIIRKYLPQIFISLLQKNINTRNFKQIELDILIWMKLRQFLINVVFSVLT